MEGWKNDESRKSKNNFQGKRWDHAKGKGIVLGKSISTTFFFMSILEDFNSKDMYKVFKQFGDLDEVIILVKLAKLN